ncbi:AlpA family phage regulatory protein [Rugamonas sp. A1-17]|nr:AlpA family phage regulatory protein [Rugamonas sp. A1-17]
MDAQSDLSTTDRLIKIGEVLKICALSRSWVYAAIRNHEFPAQVKQSKRSVAWSQKEVLEWVSKRKALR